MRITDDAQSELYDEYRASLLEQAMPEAVRWGCIVVCVLNMAFVGLDWFAYPEQFWNFLSARLILNAALVLLYFWFSGRHPEFAQNGLYLATGSLLLWVVYGAGAPMEDYYVGMVLAAVGLPVILPMSLRQAAILGSVFVVGYAVSPLVTETIFTWKAYAIHTLFLASGAFTGGVSTAYMDGARLREFIQRREIEAARDHLQEMDQLKSRFTANIHHELRTPLTLTIAPLEGILSGELGEVPEALRGYLNTMHVNSLRLLKLINNLLDLAKVEGHQMQLQRRATDLSQLVRNIIEGARPLAERKGIDLEARVEPSLPTIYVDPDLIEKVVVNLVGNALKFTPTGGQIVASLERGGMGVELVVSDTGIGLPTDQLERVFDRFAQIDGSATRNHEGTGIGLSLVKELTELHEGRAWAESDGPGCGTRMHVDLPIGQADHQSEEILESDEGEALATGQSLDAFAKEFALESREPHRLAQAGRAQTGEDRAGSVQDVDGRAPADAFEILVADDNPDMRELMASLLGSRFRVRLASNGREALDAVRERAPDLVLTDVMMPEMTGTELCRELKADPSTRAIPVVLVTSKAERQMKIDALELGADDYVAKPFHPRELMARVDALLRLRSLQVELAERNLRLESTLAELEHTQDQLIQSERLAALGEMAAGVAHEANNPINFALNSARAMGSHTKDLRDLVLRLIELGDPSAETLQARVETLLQIQDDIGAMQVVADVEELSEIVVEGLQRTGRLVGDLQQFANRAGRDRIPVDVRNRLRATISLVRSKLDDASIKVRMDFEDDPSEVLADSGALDQVFLNLFKNSMDAIGGRGGCIEAKVRTSGDLIVIDVCDDGPGPTSVEQDQLFAPFVTTKRAGHGSGLGLSISRRIIGDHGGTIEFVEKKTPGADVRIVLPAFREPSSSEANLPKPQDSAPSISPLASSAN
jgi:signal transduction histidine kinase